MVHAVFFLIDLQQNSIRGGNEHAIAVGVVPAATDTINFSASQGNGKEASLTYLNLCMMHYLFFKERDGESFLKNGKTLVWKYKAI